MPLITTPAIVLHGFRYGETSKIVRLATRDQGVQSAIAKGASRSKSAFGARLQPLSQGIAQYYYKPTRDLHTLASFDVEVQRGSLAHDVERFAAASALGELVLRCSPAEPNPLIFDCLALELDRLVETEPAGARVAALVALWRTVAALGFAPSLDQCAVDGRALPSGSVVFSVAEGGVLCARCAPPPGSAAPTLTPEDRAALQAFVVGRGGADDGDELSDRRAAAHRRLLVRFVRRHVAEERELKALSIWEGTPWLDT